MIKLRVIPYDCPRFKGAVHVTMEDVYGTSNETQPWLMSSGFKDCSKMMECGIMERHGNHFTPRWKMCPKHPDFDPSTLP